MIKEELKLADQALNALMDVLLSNAAISFIAAEPFAKAEHDHRAWYLDIITSMDYKVTFWIEGRNIANVVQVFDPNNKPLLDKNHPINVLGMLNIDQQTALEKVVMGAYDQTYANIQSS